MDSRRQVTSWLFRPASTSHSHSASAVSARFAGLCLRSNPDENFVIDTIGSPWLAYAVLLIVTGLSRLRCGSWFAPAAFVGLVWSFFTGASLLVVDYPIPGRGLWMLVVLIVAIQLGALIAHELQPQKPS